ncbi:OLC1v1006308C1 [Oldenlandia corymbosa var. corymbosa]|uniref:Calcium-transporting ATPase n=1 Tax=Oldenlandia corymbosa var. corymbosa TaxID=529605 RepID=A0AAV1DK14_OLDCO|nr:OLC1v1006308C1 [Oldenlandia corymbosa var. corymbosa]
MMIPLRDFGSRKIRKRWQLAFRALSFVTSLSKKVAMNSALLLGPAVNRTQSYVSIDMPTTITDPGFLADLDKDSLANLVKDKSFDDLQKFGGTKNLVSMLETDERNGLSCDLGGMKKRVEVFGSNTYKKPPVRSFLSFVVEALKDSTIIILFVCAVLSLGFGIKQHGIKDGWYDGGSIILAIVLVLAVSAISNFKQSRQFTELSSQSSNIEVEVMRDGRRQSVSIYDVVVGDVVCLNTGNHIPADGLFLDGHSMKVDESSMTGESDQVEISEIDNPFLISGTKVMDGYGHMLVTSVGMNTAWGQMMSTITHDVNEETPLQARLNKLTSFIGKVGLLVAFLVLVVLMIRYFTGNTSDDSGRKEFIKGQTNANHVMNSMVGIIAAAVTIIVVAIPEGLPLAVTLTLAYSMKKMMADNALVRKLSACEIMGSATVICTDKTGTLTMNKMLVTEFWFGKESMQLGRSTEIIRPGVLELLQQGVGMNTTGEVHASPTSAFPEISGSPTESAILSWAISDMQVNFQQLKDQNTILQVEPFNSQKKRSAILVRNNDTGVLQLHSKGAAEIVLAMCSTYHARNGMLQAINGDERKQLEAIITDMAARSLRCIAFACKMLNEGSELRTELLQEPGLTLLGFVGLKDPCRPEVKAAVESCRKAGVGIKMITGDNIFTARSIALDCGILKPDEDLNDAVVEGVTFRNYSPEERMERIDRIEVMARSTPFDKLLMVQCLKQKGHVVAVTGDGTNDAPALKEADIGLSMGIQGTEVAKESSDIVILDDNFNSVVTVLKWGRCVYNNIQKFIQFQLTVNVAALVINLVAAISSGSVPLTAVQLLWVNLIMDTLGALALATEQPTDDLMTKKPVGRTEPLITKIMWRNLIAQAVYQVTVLLVLQFRGSSIFGVNKNVKDTLIFNSFVFCQLFNEFNARKLEKKNIFEGILKSRLFLGIVGITVFLQIIMVELLQRFASTERLNWGQWAACIGIAVVSWPIGWLVKCIPVTRKQE